MLLLEQESGSAAFLSETRECRYGYGYYHEMVIVKWKILELDLVPGSERPLIGEF